MSDLRSFLLAMLDGKPLPPLDGADPDWKGADPASPEFQELLHAEPFISFPIHPLPPKVQQYLDDAPDLDPRERDAICEVLEQIYQLPPKFCVVSFSFGPEFWVEKAADGPPP